MEPRSWRAGHLSLQGRLDVRTQWGHEDTPALHRLGEKTQLEYIKEWSIFSPPARHFPRPSAAASPLWASLNWREPFLNCWALLTLHRSLSITVSLIFSLTFLIPWWFRGQMEKQNFEPDGTRLQWDAVDVFTKRTQQEVHYCLALQQDCNYVTHEKENASLFSLIHYSLRWFGKTSSSSPLVLLYTMF